MNYEVLPVTEPLCSRLLWNLLTNSKFHDAVLVGDDGVGVPVNRSAIAAGCPYFEARLFGNFSDSGGSTVSLKGFCEGTISDGIHFMLTGRMPRRIRSASQAASKQSAVDYKLLQELLSLHKFGCYFDVPCLCGAVTDYLAEEVLLLDLQPPTTAPYAILNHLVQHGQQGASFERGSMICSDHGATMLSLECIHCSIGYFEVDKHPLRDCCEQVLVLVLGDSRVQATEALVLNLVHSWTVHNRVLCVSDALLECINLEAVPEKYLTQLRGVGFLPVSQYDHAMECQMEALNNGSAISDRLRCWSGTIGSGVPVAMNVKARRSPHLSTLDGIYKRERDRCYTRNGTCTNGKGRIVRCVYRVQLVQCQEDKHRFQWHFVIIDSEEGRLGPSSNVVLWKTGSTNKRFVKEAPASDVNLNIEYQMYRMQT